MRFEASERIDTSVDRSAIMNLAHAQFVKISDSVKLDNDCFVAKGVEATFGSINRADRTFVDCKQLSGGWLLTAEVTYRPSVMFWIFFVLGLFTYIFWLLPIAFYLIQRNTVKTAVSEALARVHNEMRDAVSNAGSAAVAPISFVDELAKWADLKDRGVVTEDEFAAKKRQLLGA